MPVVDFIVTAPTAPLYRDQFVIEMEFAHDDGEITETETVAFPAAQKADAIEFINTLKEADDYVREHCGEPEDDEVENYEKWFNTYSGPGLSAWPSDSNGNYFAELEGIKISFYDANGIRHQVTEVENE